MVGLIVGLFLSNEDLWVMMVFSVPAAYYDKEGREVHDIPFVATRTKRLHGKRCKLEVVGHAGRGTVETIVVSNGG